MQILSYKILGLIFRVSVMGSKEYGNHESSNEADTRDFRCDATQVQ